VAAKEHGEFVSCMELIDVLPPGLYEAVITEVDESTVNPELVQGRYLFRLEGRTLDDIRSLGGNDPADDARFATVARVSEVNLGLYQTLLAPVVRSMVTEGSAEAMRATHPNRLRFAAFSDRNPMMQPVKALAESVRAGRRPVSADNPLLAMEQATSTWITSCLEAYGDFRDAMTEAVFLNTYGSPLLQALVGLGVQQAAPHHAERDLIREAREAQLRAELGQRFETGGLEEAALRALVYIRLAEGSVDERGFAMLKLVRASRPAAKRLSMARFKEILREQYLLVRLDEERALRSLPMLLGEDDAGRKAALDVLRRVLAARGEMSDESARRLARVEELFGVRLAKAVKAATAHV
jgi:hypothetical protein